MKKVIVTLFFIFLSLGGFAKEYTVERYVYTRISGSDKMVMVKKKLFNLLTPHAFESRYFKIVLGTSDQAISTFEKDRAILLKAASVYYHLYKARRFYLNTLKLQKLKKMKQITVRLDLVNAYSTEAHFVIESKDKQYNNALTISPGEDFKTKKKWGYEIWFRPRKVIEMEELISSMNKDAYKAALAPVKEQINKFAFNQWKANFLKVLFLNRESQSIPKDAMVFASTVALTSFIVDNIKVIDPLFLDKYFYLDTALMPEVIFHEYTHAIFGEDIGVFKSVAIVEGFADYFAARIGRTPLPYAPYDGVATSAGRNAEDKTLYNVLHEHDDMAHSDFVLSLLWKVKQTFPKRGDYLIIESKKHIPKDALYIHDTLTKALLMACKTICENPLRDRNKLFEIFGQKGL